MIHFSFLQLFFPRTAVFSSRPEFGVFRQQQTKESLSTPIDATPATINLNSRSKRSIKSHGRNAIFQKFRTFQKLEQCRRSYPPYPSVIHAATFVIFIQGQRSRRSKTIADAPSPHIHPAITTEHKWVVINHIVLIFHKLPCILRVLFLPEHFRPNRSVSLISPRTVIVVSRSIIIPAFAPIAFEKFLQIRLQVAFVHGISLIFQKTQNKDIEKHPVGTDSRPLSIAQHRSSQRIFLFFGERIP